MGKTIRLTRSGSIYQNKSAAMAVLQEQSFINSREDGEVLIARYNHTEEQGGQIVTIVKSILGVYHKDLSGNNGVTFIEDTSDITSILDGLDFSHTVDPNQIATNVTQLNGLVDADFANLTSITLAGYTEGAAVADIAATDTLGQALGKLQKTIHEMDKAANVVAGQVVTTVSEADGVVSETKANVKDLQLGGYSKVSNTGAIGANDTVNVALSKLENNIEANTVASDDKTLIVTPVQNGGTDLSVNVDNTTIVKDISTGVISSGLRMQSIAQSAGSTYASQYQLVYGSSNTPIGDVISVGKDQFLKEASFDPETQVLTLVMYTSDGSTTEIPIDFSSVVIEAEAGKGLYIDSEDHSLNVGVDNASESVTISDGEGGSTTAPVLSVGNDSVKVSNIQAAINYATDTLAVSAEGDNYITAGVDPSVNNKKVNVTADVQSLTATAGTPGTYDADGGQTSAPVNGTLVGTANSLVDGADVATKVKTYIDGQVAIEAARSDANTLASIHALDATVGARTVATGKHVAVEVVEADGLLTGVTVTEDDIASADELSNALNSVSAGNNAIEVSIKSNKSQTIGVKLDTTTTSGQDSYVSGTGNALKVTDYGLYLSGNWDCGTY